MEVGRDNNMGLKGLVEAVYPVRPVMFIFLMRLCPCWSPSDDERDMLELAFGLTATSRLGVRLIDESLDGLTVKFLTIIKFKWTTL